MTYLTQITLDFATAAKLQLRDTYDWHQAVWKAFPGRDGAPRDFLTRLDSAAETSGCSSSRMRNRCGPHGVLRKVGEQSRFQKATFPGGGIRSSSAPTQQRKLRANPTAR